jgi:predicted metal-dependent hydrolase
LEHVKSKYLKYLGGAIPLEEAISNQALTEEALADEIVRFYIRMSKQVTKERTKHYQGLLKTAPKSIKIDKISNRWGSCNSHKEITYHYLISTLPMDLIDYIVVHELCHLHHLNHDRSFWRKVGSILPDYKDRMKRLGED